MTCIKLNIGVRYVPQSGKTGEQRFNAEQTWVRSTAAMITHRRGMAFDADTRRDWAQDMVLDLWINAASYNPSAGDWRGWAYRVMDNRCRDIAKGAFIRNRQLRSVDADTDMMPAAMVEIDAQALEKDTLAQICAGLLEMHQEEADRRYRLDVEVLKGLSQAGGDHGSIALLSQRIGLDRNGLKAARERIAAVMIDMGMGGKR